MTTESKKSPAPEQASEAVPQRPRTENPTAEAIFEQAAGAGNLISSKFGDGKSRDDALTDDQRQALGHAISEYFGRLDSDEGVRAPEGRILRAFDYCDSRNIDDLIDRAIVPALTASPVEQPAAAPEPCAHDYVRTDRVCTECGEKVAAMAAASPAAEAVAIPVEWDQDAAIEALSDFPKGSIWYEFLEEVGFDPTSGPIYVLTVQGRAMLDQLKSAYFATPKPPAQTDAREALADERYEAILAAAEDVLEYRKRVYAAGTNTEALARQAEKTLRFLLAAHPGQTGPHAEVANDEVVCACEAHGIALPVEALDAATALVNLFAARAGERQ
ncbi:hypothetical protein [Burkholderia ubonensis]|uniref:hypothetical protein n=1 Tax=Burkholderia ubonensis TaxID=101571 RepID=UPI00075C03AE|nr:hypothetical protein [Burkholderia ubonensis]KVG77194.1 hypothetical protein WJ34_02170 [Burkholderia ubonensis]KVH15820.1 hypothetical protein WJ37_31310 [Burkholderia ubonensis]KVH53090.1 hypothetical protein WJ38_02805 [Burkholderia ubonensis]KVH82357.1 hypothetical protein WJ43_26285 [Burkholderia ubonensis]KVM29005.1 hypothetical protein WJ55_23830 [Burkholderia ubonensis]